MVKENKLTFFSDIALFVEPALSTLYEWELEKSDVIKAELAKNKLATKRKMRNKWEESDNATLQLAAYKLVADRDELNALTMNRVDANLSGSIAITWNEERTYEADKEANEGA